MPTNDRVRTRVDYNPFIVPQTGSINGVLVDSAPIYRWTKYHWMLDQINPIDHSINRRRPGLCQHLKIDKKYSAPSFSYVNQHNGASVLMTNPDNVSRSLDYGPGLTPTGSSTDVLDNGGYSSSLFLDFLKTPRFSDLCFEAWTKLKTQVPADISVLNFIYELKDFGPLAKALSKIPASVKNSKLGQTLADPLKGKGKGKKAAKAVNNTFLAYNFTWAPFVGDLITLTQLSDSVAKRMDFLRKTRGKEVTIRFQKLDCYIDGDLGVPVLRGTNSNPWKTTFTRTKYQCDFVVTCKLFQELEGLDDAWADLRATIAALGINNPAKAVWNAIPFSFLVDWVAPFGKWLERAAVQPFYGVWKVYDITTSVRERSEVEVELSSTDQGYIAMADTLITRVSGDNYIRMVGLPQTLGAIDFSQLTSTQQKLFLSLVLTKVL